jgi:hypothetical protein
MATISTNFIFNETLVGTVDGVNTVFTSAQPIGSIEDLRLGGVDYTDFSFVQGSQTVTLTDAPTVGTGAPRMDYFVYEATPAVVGTTQTFGGLVDSTYMVLGHDRASEQFQEDLVKEKLNEASRVLNNSRNNPKLKLGSYSFNPTGEIEATAYSATEISVGTVPAGTPADGVVVLRGASPVEYTGLSASAFTGLTGLGFAYEAGDVVNVGYQIPSAAKKVSAVYVDGVRLDYVDFRLFSNYSKSYVDETNRYTVWRNSAGDEFLLIPASCEDTSVVTVHYVPVNLQYDDDADLLDFEPEYRQLLSLYAAYKCCLYREDDRWQTFKNEYDMEFQKYKAYLRRAEGTQSKVVSTALRGF